MVFTCPLESKLESGSEIEMSLLLEFTDYFIRQSLKFVLFDKIWNQLTLEAQDILTTSSKLNKKQFGSQEISHFQFKTHCLRVLHLQ